MFDMLFGWRKASKCKKLIKTVQCRLKILKNKRFVIAKQLKEDIAELLKNGLEQSAFNRLEQLHKDENMMSVYELLDHFSEFIVLNLSYIRRHKEIPNDINEAVSTLIFASARCGDLPELRLIRKLFGERYGQRFVVAAVELHNANLVNRQVKDKLTPQESVPEDVKNRLLDEIVRDYFFKPGPLALEYKPGFQLAQQEKIDESNEFQGQDRDVEGLKSDNFPQLCLPYYEHTTQDSMIYIDDVEEFKSPTKQDQSFFVFKSSSTIDKIEIPRELEKRVRRRSVSKTKQTINDAQCEDYYYSNKRHYRRKYRKEIQIDERERIYFLNRKPQACDCSLDRPCYLYINNNDLGYEILLWRQRKGIIEEMGLTSPSPQTPRSDNHSMNRALMTKCGPPPPYVKAPTTAQRRLIEHSKADNEVNCRRKLGSPRHVHPKLPDYDEIQAKFMALKKVHQQNKCTP